jgi:hypothetical protein
MAIFTPGANNLRQATPDKVNIDNIPDCIVLSPKAILPSYNSVNQILSETDPKNSPKKTSKVRHNI